MVLGALFAMFALGSLASQTPGMPAMSGGIMGAIYLVFALIYFFPIRFLYRFAKNMKLAEASGDQTSYNEAFKNLKSYFKFIGIFMAIIIGLYLLMLVGLLGFGAMF